MIAAKAELEKDVSRSRMSSRPEGVLFIVSAPSGTGKTTLVSGWSK